MMMSVRHIVYAGALTAACFVSGTALFAQALHVADLPDRYVVQTGDTLWDVAERFFGDPFRWMHVWEKNPDIADPHWIYPGNVLNLQKILQQSVQAEKRALPVEYLKPEVVLRPVEKPLSDVPGDDAQDTNMHVLLEASEQHGVGTVLPGASGRMYFGQHDMLFVQCGSAASRDDMFSVYRQEHVLHAWPDGDELGALARYVGTVRVMAAHDDSVCQVQVIDSAIELMAGDIVVDEDMAAMTNDVLETDVSPSSFQGRVLYVLDGLQAGNGQWLVVDGGYQQGLKQGDVLQATRARSSVQGRGSADIALPDILLGSLRVEKPGLRLALVYVQDAAQSIQAGDAIRRP